MEERLCFFWSKLLDTLAGGRFGFELAALSSRNGTIEHCWFLVMSFYAPPTPFFFSLISFVHVFFLAWLR